MNDEYDDKKRKSPREIIENSLLLVEGKDECNFFKSLLKTMKINGIEIKDVGGRKQFANKIPSIKKIKGFSKVTKLGFIRDAEDNYAKSAFDSVCNNLNENGIIPPKNIGKVENIGKYKIGIFIMPNNKDKGMLETLCLQSIKNEHCYKEMEIYIECLKEFYKNNEKEFCESSEKKFNIDKARSQVYLASKIPIQNSLGLGALKGQWDFESYAFYEIKTFLNNLFG